MKMKGMKKAVSLLLAAALVVTLFSGQGTMLAAKKSGKTKAKVSSVKITNTGKKLRLQKGKKFRLKTSVKVKPNNSKNKKLKFTSSNRKVVLVNSRGLLKGLRVGTAKITAASKLNPKKKASLSVSVTKDVLVTNIKLNKTKITADEFNENEIPLKVTKILPSNAKNKKVIWSTDDESVADVDDSGVVTTGDVGTATITATAADKGGAYATCRVTVVENSSRGDDADVTEQPVDVTQKPPVQEEPGEVTASADVPTQEPEQGEISPSPEEPEETASSEPGNVTAEPTEEPEKETTPKPTETFEPVSYDLSNPTIDDNGTTTWDCVYFGNYWQEDTDGDEMAIYSDEKQPIKWRVLSVDGDDAFLLADKNLDCRSYNYELTGVTWETSTLRSWLNDEFFTNAFTAREQAAVKKTLVANKDNTVYGTDGGADTEDYVYLLSEEEVRNRAYGFSADTSAHPAREVRNTAFVKMFRGKTSTSEEYKDNGVWWLRSPGNSRTSAIFVNHYGLQYQAGAGINDRYQGVRPALHLKLSSTSDWSYAGTVTSEKRVSAPKPEGTPDPFVPQGEGWQKLDISRWTGDYDDDYYYPEQNNMVLLDNVEFETVSLPEILENIGDKVEIIVRGSVSEDSTGFRFWMANAERATMSQQYYYTRQAGVGLREAGMELDVDGTAGEFHPGESFQLQTVLENVYWDARGDSVCTKLMFKAPAFGAWIEGVTITSIWVRYGDAIGTAPDVSPTPAGGTPTPEPFVPGVGTGVVEHGLNNPMIGDDGSTTWDCVYFGNYWQNDTNGDGIADTDDEKQPIKWRVLSVNGDDAFLLSDENLDTQRYNDKYVDVTWETCMMRSWLNGYGAEMNQSGKDYSGDGFIDHAFSAGEQSAIKTVRVVNNGNPTYSTDGGNDTSDKVYLLSIEEATNPAYGFSSNYNKYDIGRRTKNTEYTVSKGAYTNTSIGYEGNGGWWLRSLGGDSIDAAGVHDYGYVSQFGYKVNELNIPVRVALHLNLSLISSWSYAGTVTSEDRKPAAKPEGTPDPFVPEGEGWQKLDLSQWSGNSNHYSEEGDMVLLDNVELETVPLPESLDNIGDKMEIIVRGSVSESSRGFRFWMTNAWRSTMSQQYYYTRENGVGLRKIGVELDADATAGEFHPGESFQLQTVLENVNWDAKDDYVCTDLMLKGPTYGDFLEGITITGIWVRYGDAIGTTPDVSPTPAEGTPTPEPFVPGVGTGVVEHGLNNPMIGDDGSTTWDCVYFGNYWQNDTNGDGIADTDDEKQPIKWRVLSVDGDDAFLVADENLDSQPYNNELLEVTWETSTLRSWLNDDFFTQAFTAREQSAVKKTVVVNKNNTVYGAEGGEDTEDYVYLLSEEEVRNRAYGFSSDTSIHPAREARNTAYAKTQGVKTGPSEKYKDNGVWWLRSPGSREMNAIFVNYYGLQFQAGTGVDDSRQGIRPALHLKLSSASDWSYAGTVTSEQRKLAQKPEGTPDPFVPEGEGWQKLDISQWSGYYDDNGYYYSEEGNMVLLDNVELLTLPLPEILGNSGDKMEIIVRGSVSEDSTGFRFWMTNARGATLSQPYYYTKQYGVGLREVGMELDVDATAGEFHPGESFQLRTVLENVNWDLSADSVCRNLMFKAPSYGECMEGVTITGIWVHYGNAIETTPAPEPFEPGVETGTVE